MPVGRMGWGLMQEVRRKAVHLLQIIIIFIYILAAAYGTQIALTILAFLLVLALEAEYVRLELRAKIPGLRHLWKLKRPSEQGKLGGEVFFLLGAILTLAIFDLRVATAAILMTTFGDLAAALVGKAWGRHRISWKPQKTWEGVVAELAVNVAVGVLFVRATLNDSLWWLSSATPLGEPLWPVIVVMALTATVVETVISRIDDNLLIPVFSGFNGQIVLYLLSLPRVYG